MRPATFTSQTPTTGLVPWLRREDFGKYSRTRNRLIASMLLRTPYVEKMGTGVMRVNQALEKAGLPSAEFNFDEFSFSITLFSAAVASDGGVNGGVNELLDFIQNIQVSGVARCVSCSKYQEILPQPAPVDVVRNTGFK